MQKSPKQIANEKMWRTVFSGNYRSRQKALLKAHANNPEFQDWLDKSGHGAGLSVGKANKAPTVDREAQKQREKKSLKAYGATKGTRMGSEDGSGEAIRDTIAPLTRDQHAKVQTAKRAAAVAGKLDTKEKRAEFLKKLAIKPTAPAAAEDFDDEGHDDLTDVLHYSLHIPRGTRGMDEEVEQIDEATPGYSRETRLARNRRLTGSPTRAPNLDSLGRARRPLGYSTKNAIKFRLGMDQKGDPSDYDVKPNLPEEVEQVDELNYEYNMKRLPPKGFTVPHQQNPHLHYNPETNQVHNTRTGETYPDYGNEFVGYRMQNNEEVNLREEPKDQADVGEYDYEGDMAKSQLRSILANAKRLHDMLEENTNLPEWVQSKITLAQDYILTAASYMEGEMNEEVEQIDERNKLNKSRKDDIARQIAAHAVIGSEVPYDMIHSPLRSGRNIMRKVTSARASQLYRKLPNPIKKEEVEKDHEAANWRRVSAMPKGSATGGKDEVNKHLAYLKAVHNHRKKFGYDTTSVRDKIERINRSGIAEEVEQVDEASKNLRFDPEAALQTTAPVVNIWQKAQSGDPRAKAAWAKHVRRIQKVEPTGMTKQGIEDHMQSNFGNDNETGADQAVQRAMEKELKYNPHYRMQEKTERALKLAVNAAKTTKNKMVNMNPQLDGIKDNSNNGT